MQNILTCIKVILHQFWVKKLFPWKFNLEYGGTFTKLFMHVSSRNMFPTTRNMQICVHVYQPRHCCGDWLTFGCFVTMIAGFIKDQFPVWIFFISLYIWSMFQHLNYSGVEIKNGEYTQVITKTLYCMSNN